MGKLEMMSWTPLVILSSFLFLQALSAEADSGASRKPKLFYVSTQVNTFTFTTNSVCVLSTTTALVACPTKRKKRQLNLDDVDGLNIEPSEVSSGLEQAEVRRPKFLQYWLTTTSTTTITTFSATSTMFSLQCTPSGFPLAACG